MHGLKTIHERHAQSDCQLELLRLLFETSLGHLDQYRLLVFCELHLDAPVPLIDLGLDKRLLPVSFAYHQNDNPTANTLNRWAEFVSEWATPYVDLRNCSAAEVEDPTTLAYDDTVQMALAACIGATICQFLSRWSAGNGVFVQPDNAFPQKLFGGNR